VDLETTLADLPHAQILGDTAALKAAIVAVIAVLPEWQRAAVLTRMDAFARAMPPGQAVQGERRLVDRSRGQGKKQTQVGDWLPGDPRPVGPVPPEPPGNFRQDMHTRAPRAMTMRQKI